MKEVLRGRRIVVTRPEHQVHALKALIEHAGGQALVLPLLRIEMIHTARWPEAQTTPFDWIIFTSVNAVESAFASSHAAKLRTAKHYAAIGRATADALAAQGIAVACLPTTGFNSEALLSEMPFRTIGGQSVLLVKGEGGRTVLADTLRERGAMLSVFEIYRRLPPDAVHVAQWREWLTQGVDAITLTSGEACEHLLAMTPPSLNPCLFAVPLAVVSARLAAQARATGFAQIAVAAQPGDAALIEALCTLLTTGGACGRVD